MKEDERIHKITYEQMMELRRKTWAIAFKLVGDQWYCHILLLGGRTEEVFKQIINP